MKIYIECPYCGDGPLILRYGTDGYCSKCSSDVFLYNFYIHYLGWTGKKWQAFPMYYTSEDVKSAQKNYKEVFEEMVDIQNQETQKQYSALPWYKKIFKKKPFHKENI